MKDSKTLFFFCINFPYHSGESFIVNEFPYLEQYFDKVHVITSAKANDQAHFPDHITTHSLHDIIDSKNRARYFLRNLGLILQILLIEFASCSSMFFFIKNSRSYISELINACICAEYITKLSGFTKDAIFYSFWMNNHALTLSVLKMKRKINRFVFRVHGYDLILERWPNRFIAFQATCHKYVDQIYTVSRASLNYFKSTYPGSRHKAKVAYLGSAERGENSPKVLSSGLRIVSCSNIIPLKRLHLIIEVLKDLDLFIEWVHFGDGYLKEEIINKTAVLPGNIRAVFKGNVSQDELFEYYNQNHIDFFMNVSDSEGLPFTIIEALSFGIPVVATNVGGTAEIVNEKTGLLLEEHFDVELVRNFLREAKDSLYCSGQFRQSIKQLWKQTFYAGNIYPEFIQHYLMKDNHEQ